MTKRRAFPRWLLAALGIAVAAVCWLSRGRDVAPATPRSEEHEEANVAADGSFSLPGLQHGVQYVLLAFAGDDKVAEARAVAGSAECVVIAIASSSPANARR
jgi:hypothetical protein